MRLADWLIDHVWLNYWPWSGAVLYGMIALALGYSLFAAFAN